MMFTLQGVLSESIRQGVTTQSKDLRIIEESNSVTLSWRLSIRTEQEIKILPGSIFGLSSII